MVVGTDKCENYISSFLLGGWLFSPLSSFFFLKKTQLFRPKSHCFSVNCLIMVEFPKVFNKQSISAPIEDSDELTVDIYENNDKPLFSDFEKSCSVTIPRNSKLL